MDLSSTEFGAHVSFSDYWLFESSRVFVRLYKAITINYLLIEKLGTMGEWLTILIRIDKETSLNIFFPKTILLEDMIFVLKPS